MTRKVQLAVQAVAIVAQFTLDDIPGISAEWLKFSHSLLAGLQALSAWMGHSYNPDGTPAVVAYQKTTKP